MPKRILMFFSVFFFNKTFLGHTHNTPFIFFNPLQDNTEIDSTSFFFFIILSLSFDVSSPFARITADQ